MTHLLLALLAPFAHAAEDLQQPPQPPAALTMQAPGWTLTGTLTALPPAPCYADCDASGQLTPADLTCFLQRFAAGDPWANCDRSQAAPLLDVQDFSCFLQRYAAGCNR